MATTYTANTPIPKPIVLVEVAKLLGTNIKDVGRLCTSGKINMWAKYKPFSLYLTDGSYNGNINSQGVLFYDTQDVEVRNNANYGLAVTGSSPMYYWTFNKPRLGKADPARLEDFWGYLHNAKAPYSIRVKNILETSPIEVDTHPVVFVYSVKGFQLLNKAEDKTEFIVYVNDGIGAYEYPTDFFSGYNHIVLCIKLDNNAYTYWNVKQASTNHYSASFVLPLNPLNTPEDYDAVMLLSTTELTYDGDKGTTAIPTSINPLLSKNNKFTLRLNRVTVWDNSYISWSSLQVYLTERKTNVSYATGASGALETWNYYKITSIKTTCDITFDSKYARSFYMFLAGAIGYSGTTSTTDTNNPFRIVKASEIATYGSLENALKNISRGGEPFESNDYQYYDKLGGMSCSFTKEFDFTDNIYICVKTNTISTINAYISETLDGYSRNNKTDVNYSCGTGSSYTKQIDFSKLNSGTINSYISL